VDGRMDPMLRNGLTGDQKHIHVLLFLGSEHACLRTGKPVILRIPCEARECHVC
jgi:hypothetical protein